MADVFFSYAREDQDYVAPLAARLEAAGLSAWWDRHIPAGSSFSQTIHHELTKASCVVVLWSAASAQSDWVKDEADEGKRRGVLLPALLRGGSVPLGYRQLQTVDLSRWDGSSSTPDVADFVRAALSFCTPSVSVAPYSPQTQTLTPAGKPSKTPSTEGVATYKNTSDRKSKGSTQEVGSLTPNARPEPTGDSHGLRSAEFIRDLLKIALAWVILPFAAFFGTDFLFRDFEMSNAFAFWGPFVIAIAVLLLAKHLLLRD